MKRDLQIGLLLLFAMVAALSFRLLPSLESTEDLLLAYATDSADEPESSKKMSVTAPDETDRPDDVDALPTPAPVINELPKRAMTTVFPDGYVPDSTGSPDYQGQKNSALDDVSIPATNDAGTIAPDESEKNTISDPDSIELPGATIFVDRRASEAATAFQETADTLLSSKTLPPIGKELVAILPSAAGAIMQSKPATDALSLPGLTPEPATPQDTVVVPESSNTPSEVTGSLSADELPVESLVQDRTCCPTDDRLQGRTEQRQNDNADPAPGVSLQSDNAAELPMPGAEVPAADGERASETPFEQEPEDRPSASKEGRVAVRSYDVPSKNTTTNLEAKVIPRAMRAGPVHPFYQRYLDRGEYFVREGDTLANIAHRLYRNERMAERILSVNHGIIAREDDLRPGMRLRLP